MLPIALQPFAHYRQFITYELRPSSRPGKQDKIPTDWRTGQAADAHDPAVVPERISAIRENDTGRNQPGH